MKLSVFPRANWIPKDKKDKNTQGMLVSYPNKPEIKVVNDEDSLIELVTSYAWSPSVFSEYRRDEDFISSDFMVLDIDSGMSIADAEKRVQSLGLACLCLPSPSYSEENQKFRLIFPLAKTIINSRDFDATWDFLQDKFPELDRQCSDECRFYCPSKLGDGFWQDGDFLVPTKAKEEVSERSEINATLVAVPEDKKEIVKLLYGKEREQIPEAVSFFLENAHTGLEGLWVNSLNSCCFSLALSGVDDTIIESVMEKIAPASLDKTDLYQIRRACRDGKRQREV